MQTIFSRSFTIDKNGEYKTMMVPLADMANHYTPPNKSGYQCTWDYCEEKNGFYIKAKENIREGEEVNISYGQCISNSTWFYQYGFIYQPNNCDQVKVKV